MTPEIDLWCRGCRHTGERPLSEDERLWVRRLRASHLRRVALGLLLLPCVVALDGILAVRFPHATGSFPFLMWLFTTTVVAIPVAFLIVRDHVVAAGRLSQDLAAGTALTFEPPEPGEAAAFALLRHAGRVLDSAAGGLDAAREDVIQVERHTGAQMYAPLSLRTEGVPTGVRLEQRPLSGPERLELDRIRRRLRVPGVSTVLALAVLVGLITLFLSARGKRVAPVGYLPAALWMLLCLAALVRYVRSVFVSERIREDLRIGLVVRVDQPPAPAGEFLPRSGLAWRLAGAPAGWRNRADASERLRGSL